MSRGRKKGSKDSVKRVRRTKKQMQEESTNKPEEKLPPVVEETKPEEVVEEVVEDTEVDSDIATETSDLLSDEEDYNEDDEDNE